MANEIGFSTIYPSSGLGSAGPIGATGATGANQSVRGSTGATGLDSNYITSVLVNQDTGVVEFGLSDGTVQSPGILQGATGIYAGVTAFSIGSGISILNGVCGGITLDFYNFRTDGLLGITYSTDGALVFTISANSGAGGISPYIENNRIVYAESKTTIMSTDLIPEASTGANRVGNNNYGYVNFGGETAGRNIVTDVVETSLSVGPIERGEFVVNISDFYVAGVEGITLDLSRATVYNLVTPIGIKAFTINNIGDIPDGQVMSVTLIVHGEDVWNFPEDVVFDAESKPIFYPGVNILHMWKNSSTDSIWRASFTARAIGVSNVKNPGVRGSCCYFDVDGTKHCDDYVTQTYCTERSGNFEGIVPCNKNLCTVGQEQGFDGVCCTEGKCVSDIDPSLCQIIGGYFISGITCGDVGYFEETDETDNIKPNSGLCFNKCKTPTICCKNGTCLGQLTEAHCDYLEGITVRGANDCNSAKCCDHILAPGACCTQTNTGAYQCTVVDTPYECNSTSGIYMGKNTTCNSDEDICCTVADQITCYDCITTSNGCSCNQVPGRGDSCEEIGLYTSETCNGECQTKKCHKCSGTTCTEETTECGEECSDGFIGGACILNVTCQNKTCYKSCVAGQCAETVIDLSLDNNNGTTCNDLTFGRFPNETCDCVTVPPGNEPHAACFWCFPILLDSNILMNLDSAGNRLAATPNIDDTTPQLGQEDAHVRQVSAASQAPFRSVFSVSAAKAAALNDAAGYVEGSSTLSPRDNATMIGITLPAGLNPNGYSLSRTSNILYYDETDTTAFDPNSILQIAAFTGTQGEVLKADVYTGLNERDVRFRCNYVGSYEHNANKSQARTKCLERYGYTESEGITNLDSCLLCDPVNYKIFEEQTEFIDNVIEPYQDRIKAGLYAPFPPLWGRITYTWDLKQCTGVKFRQNTYNLNLFTPSSINSIVTAFLLKKGKSWLNEFLTQYDSHDQFGDNPKNEELYNGLLTSIKQELVGSVESRPPESVEPCVPDSQRYNYDPYGLGCLIDYCSAHVVNGRDCFDDPPPGCCLNELRGWALPLPNFGILPGPPPEARLYYPVDGNGFPNQTIQSVGERYLRKLPGEDNDSSFVRGIFGRNLRYNLDSFRSSTVFYHNQVDIKNNPVFATTMKESDKIIIPIANISSWESEPTPLCGPCNPEGCGCGTSCHEEPPGSGQCVPNNVGGPCPNYREPPELVPSNWFPNMGFISPSTLINNTPFKVQIKKSQISTKSVYITPGICVDMLCPDCNSYESC